MTPKLLEKLNELSRINDDPETGLESFAVGKLVTSLETCVKALEKINGFYVDYELGELTHEALCAREALTSVASIMGAKDE